MADGYTLAMKEEAAWLALDLGKANAMDDRFFDVLHRGLDEAEKHEPCGLVLTGSGRHFCAGLNLEALRGKDRPEMKAFMGRFRQGILRLLEFPVRTVAAINGHAIAGGAILAASCRVRLAVLGDYRIGVRETALGVGLPRAAMEVLRRALTPARLEEMVLFGRLYSPEETLEMGFIEELVRPERLERASLRRALRDREVPRPALDQVHRLLVAPWAEAIRRGGEDEDWLDTWFSQAARERIDAALSRMKERKSGD